VTSRALAFMANDRYLNWTKVFLESVRAKDAVLPIYCIPHGGPMEGVLACRDAFGFELLTDGLDRLDAFAKRLYPDSLARHRANLRKYVALNLPVDEIAYFDIDMVMLVEPDRLFGHIEAGQVDLVYYATSPRWVYWPDKIDEAQALFPDMRLISAGAFLTSPKVLSIDSVIGTVEDNLDLYRSLRRSGVFDQPALNFALHRLGKRCRHITELDSSLCGMVSVRNPDLRWVNGKIVNRTMSGDVLAVHWAGPAKSLVEWFNPRTWEIQRFLRSVRQQADERLRKAQSRRPPLAGR
jgi:hypothetical protein